MHLRRLLTLAGTGVAMIALVACGSAAPGTSEDNPNALVVYNAQHESMTTIWADAFTKETGIEVVLRHGKDFELANQIKASRIDPSHIVFQISEQIATEYLADAAELAAGLRKAGFLFAPEHFGTGRDPQRLLANLPLNYVKIDGTLMQGLAVDQGSQQRVREFVDLAKSREIRTIAERVEDANTMAVLWQLGVEFIQGYFVNAPEEVVLG